jgi:hypothetical protein
LVSFTEYEPDFDEAYKHVIIVSGNQYNIKSYYGNLVSQTDLDSDLNLIVENGNVVGEENPSISALRLFTFDTKNSPFKNVSNYDVFKFLDEENEIGSVNNVTKVTLNPNYILNTITRTYNANDYPLTETIYDSNGEVDKIKTYTYY